MNWFKALENIIKEKLSLISNSIYLKAITPKTEYKLSINFDKIDTELLLVRRSNKSYEETFDEMGYLREQAIAPVEMPNLSLNLLGANFKIKHIDFIQKNLASDAWAGGKVRLSELMRYTEVRKNSIPIFIWYKDVNNKSFPYERPKGQLQALQLETLGYDIKQIASSTLIPLNGITKVIHAPTNSNYWHVELAMMQSDGSYIIRKNTGSAWGGKAAQAVLDIIISNAFDSINQIKVDYTIQEENYLN